MNMGLKWNDNMTASVLRGGRDTRKITKKNELKDSNGNNSGVTTSTIVLCPQSLRRIMLVLVSVLVQLLSLLVFLHRRRHYPRILHTWVTEWERELASDTNSKLTTYPIIVVREEGRVIVAKANFGEKHEYISIARDTLFEVVGVRT